MISRTVVKELQVQMGAMVVRANDRIVVHVLCATGTTSHSVKATLFVDGMLKITFVVCVTVLWQALCII